MYSKPRNKTRPYNVDEWNRNNPNRIHVNDYYIWYGIEKTVFLSFFSVFFVNKTASTKKYISL